MKHLLFFLLLHLSLSTFAQGGILLKKNDFNRYKVLEQNSRIKVTLNNGQILRGKFTIIDEQSILVDNQSVNLNDVAKIRANSIARQIFVPISITLGTYFGIFAVAGAVAGGLAIIATLIGLPLAIPLLAIPLSQNNHLSSKWSYKIIENDADFKDKLLKMKTNPNIKVE
jgi:small nuclear ribonucleoprotein (snRNP)-like protein